MASLLERLFKVVQSSLNSFIKRFEDPIKLAEQGIRDLKVEFDQNLKGLAEVKAIAISTKHSYEEKILVAKDYENKAKAILKNAQAGVISESEGDRLAAEALNKKQEALTEAASYKSSIEKYNMMIKKFEERILQSKQQIQKWENQIKTLKARHVVAVSSKKINQNMVALDSSSTVGMLEEMKNKITEEEALADAYSEMGLIENDLDKEINAAAGTNALSSDVQMSLAELKNKMLSDDLSSANSNESSNDTLLDEKNELDN